VYAVAVDWPVVIAAGDRNLSIEAVGQLKVGKRRRLQMEQAADKVFDKGLTGKESFHAISRYGRYRRRRCLYRLVTGKEEFEIQQLSLLGPRVELVLERAADAEVQLGFAGHAARKADKRRGQVSIQAARIDLVALQNDDRVDRAGRQEQQKQSDAYKFGVHRGLPFFAGLTSWRLGSLAGRAT
jgi:hypothetical protein